MRAIAWSCRRFFLVVYLLSFRFPFFFFLCWLVCINSEATLQPGVMLSLEPPRQGAGRFARLYDTERGLWIYREGPQRPQTHWNWNTPHVSPVDRSVPRHAHRVPQSTSWRSLVAMRSSLICIILIHCRWKSSPTLALCALAFVQHTTVL